MLSEPASDCQLCPRLATMRQRNRQAYPGWFNRPVPSFGDQNARLLIVGLAPGLQGANRTGRPFTGDYAGDLLYATLAAHGFSTGQYGASAQDGLQLVDCMITNSVRCVPPQNKPDRTEIMTCRRHLDATIRLMPRLKVILALGKIAHDSTASVLGLRPSRARFAHGAHHTLPDGPVLISSYHCSRYNTNTRRLTPEMFDAVFENIRDCLAASLHQSAD
ncbi:MAG: uracil-DNA glycosylase [Alphaproteobacteria bacterium]|nr:uracil-DNA glycosylase [Alphaproteobacteria bacterium]